MTPVEERIDHAQQVQVIAAKLWERDGDFDRIDARFLRERVVPLLTEHSAREELVEAAVALADYWPSQNVEKHYSERMQRFLKAVRALPATESAQPEEERR